MSDTASSFLTALKGVLSGDALLLGAEAAEAGSGDRSRHAPCAPLAVALPCTVAEVQAIVRLCAVHSVPITPRGAATGVEGGAIPIRGGVALDTARLKGVTVQPGGLAVVGAGVRKLELAKALAPHGLLFGPDPSSNPSLGGMASTSASGMTTLRYGTTREAVASMLVVTPSGELIRTRTPVRKSSTGLDLNQLFIGSEGTLGVIVELTVRTHPVPAARAGSLLRFPSTHAAAQAVAAILDASLPTLLRCELLNAEAVAATNAVFGSAFPPLPTLFIECAGASAADVRREAAAAAAAAARCGGDDGGEPLTEGAAIDDVFELRRGCYAAALKYRPGSQPDSVLTTDVCVPLHNLPAVIAETEADARAAGLVCIICAHIADGNFHALLPYRSAEEERRCHEAEARLIRRAIAAGGTVSGEHGVGMGKIEHCLAEHGSEHLRIQARIKRALDPSGIMNPGKVYLYEEQQPHARL